MIQRRNYTDLIRLYMNKPFIKVITGLHRCGKTTVLRWVREELQKNGTSPQDILCLSFDTLRHIEIRDGEALLQAVRKRREESENRLYLLLDEIQYLPGWEKAIKELYRKENCDIYLTGSRAGILESQDASLISRNCVQIRMYPYSYSEYLEQIQEEGSGQDSAQSFHDFLVYGSMPGIHRLEKEEDQIWQYLLDTCKAGILQDAVQEKNLRNVGQLWMIFCYLAEHLGEPASPKTIADGLNQSGCQISKDTVYAMLKALESGHLVYRARRYDLKEARTVEAREKYYFTDWGMYHALEGFREEKISGVLENMVCLELLSRGFRVYRGKIGRKEFDFLAERGREQYCIQIRAQIPDEQAFAEAAEILSSLKGNYTRLVLSLDEERGRVGKNGVKHRNLAAFLENT
ncbi:MAG: ATP-binding protein [Eubacteriales bacterium]|nr:ATP-binding protein [Eubacteriales bacterium]